jgi:hypothetical protein
LRADTNRKHNMGKRFAIVIGVAATGVMALGAQTAMADSVGRTEGDARAAFNAEPGGGMAIAFTHCRGVTTETTCPNSSGQVPNGSATGGIPPWYTGTDPKEWVRIYPYESGSYCASGWHVIFVSWWELADGLSATSPGWADAFAYLDAVDLQFAWDGVPLVEERTATKRLVDFPEPGLEDVFWFNSGTFMPPGSLSVGRHRLSLTAFDPLYEEENGTSSVRITILPC